MKTSGLVTAGMVMLWSVAARGAPDLELRKTVDTPTPAAGQPVEFTIVVRNIGADPALDVHVHDLLPPELQIPMGMAAFPSSGSYDATSGDWAVGDLAPGLSSTLVIPAIIASASPPICIVNIAETTDTADPNGANNRAAAGIRQPIIERCVDLSATFSGPPLNMSFLNCDDQSYDTVVDVVNRGPDPVHEVVVDLGQNPRLAPNLRFAGVLLRNPSFTAADCVQARCLIETLGPGETIRLKIVSDNFRVSSERTHTLTLVVSSGDPDYAPEDNQVSRDVLIPAFTSCGDFGLGEGPMLAGCFIATAAYGTPLESHVVTLRHFRDRYLQRSALGRAFIRFYYRHSPPLAKVISEHEGLRMMARALLTPLVFAIAYPYWALAIATLMLLLLLVALRRSAERRSTRLR
jgi:uncharacterized repeat protein (TIGR01451 family)